MRHVYDYFMDAGHGWVKVPINELVQLGIAHKISDYSYIYKKNAYLEEDCDATLWAKAKGDNNFRTRARYSENSRIRSYVHYDYQVHVVPLLGEH